MTTRYSYHFLGDQLLGRFKDANNSLVVQKKKKKKCGGVMSGRDSSILLFVSAFENSHERHQFGTADKVKVVRTEALKDIPEEIYRYVFDAWKSRQEHYIDVIFWCVVTDLTNIFFLIDSLKFIFRQPLQCKLRQGCFFVIVIIYRKFKTLSVCQ